MKSGSKRVTTHKRLRIDTHLRRRSVELHIVLADTTTVLHGLDALLDAVGGDGATVDAGLGDEEETCGGNEGQ